MSLGGVNQKFFDRLGEMFLGWVKLKSFFIDLGKCLDGLMKLIFTSYRIGEMFRGFLKCPSLLT